MRAFQLFAVMAAVSAAPKFEATIKFGKACVHKCGGVFTDPATAMECIESVPHVANKCETVIVSANYTLDNVRRCDDPKSVATEGLSTEDFIETVATFERGSYLSLRGVLLDYKEGVLGACEDISLGTTFASDEGCRFVRDYYGIYSQWQNNTIVIKTLNMMIDLTDYALRVDLNGPCILPPKVDSARLMFEFDKKIEAPVVVKDATIVFPNQPQCALDACNAIVGTKGVKLCLDKAAADPYCRKAVYTRTYINLGSGRCDSDAPNRVFLSMLTIFEDDWALDYKDKRTTITSVKFSKKPIDATCPRAVLYHGLSCSSQPRVTSTLEENPLSPFTFTGEEVLIPFTPSFSYFITSSCDLIDNPDGDEVTVKTEFTIPHNFAASGSSASNPLAGLIDAAKDILGISSQ